MYKGRDLVQELDAATSAIVAAYGLLEDAIVPQFDEMTCKGLLTYWAKASRKSQEQVAVEWMEEHFDALYASCEAVRVLAELTMDKLEMLPRSAIKGEPDDE